MKKTAIGAVLLVAFLTSISAQNIDAVEKRALKAFSREMTDCAAYFLIAGEGVRRDDHRKTAKDYKQMAERLLGRSAEISTEDAIHARLARSLERQRLELDGDYENSAAKLVKYARPCQHVHDNPEGRVKQWAFQIRAE